ncbi:MAG: hypothetical protein Tsb0021_18460 [Chlamydiales bacterium]
MNDLEDTLNCITQKTAQQVEKEIPALELAGVGGSMKDNVINHKKLVFNHRGTLNENSGMLLLAKVVKLYLKNIHSEKKMEKYLEKHLFTYKNLQIVFFIYDNNGDALFYPELVYVSLVDGFVSYQTVKKSEKGIYKVKTQRKEPYEEEVKRLEIWKNQP